ncbi:MAG: DUF3617 domain-containing protein [Pseudomonadota bacterium]
MKRILFSIFALAALPAAVHAAPGTDMKPGLWEINNKMKAADPQTDQMLAAVLQQLGNMPAEQRKQVEEMAKQNGMSMPKVGPDGGLGITACVTPEMAARKEIPTGQQGDCTSNNVPVAGGMTMSFRCTNPPSSGEGKLSFINDSAFTMKMNVTSSARGKPEQMTVDTTGKWLSATCPAAQ